MATQPPINPQTGQPMQFDPATGQPIQPQQMYNPQTGQPIAQQQVQYDPQTGQPIAPQQPQPQTTTVGSPETGPIQIESSPNSAPERSTEYGHEAIRRIEQQPQPEKAAEQMEQRAQPRPQQPQAPAQKPKPKKTGPEPPSFYGYKVPLNISTNSKLIAEKKGTGDTSDARTWVYMFLDRLLKKQTQQS